MRALLAVGMLGACTEPDLIDRTRMGEVMPDFMLFDENATSPTAGQDVSVSDQRGSVSAWYFGHST